MHVSLENIGKKFGREWIFRAVNREFAPGKPTVILGSNGSGKSTLLQVVAGSLMQGEGTLKYTLDGKSVSQENVYRYVSIASPYLELMEEFTLAESIAFHGRFKQWRNGLDAQKVLELSGLEMAKNKQVKNFSSGMKMRVRLLLAILSDTPLLLLDEPCSNLDRQGCEWYAQLIRDHSGDRTVIVCSNQVREEFFFCTEQIEIGDYKR
jgi:ABC-type multidrug transport system ATPase subunit